jgi:hypothetical protein
MTAAAAATRMAHQSCVRVELLIPRPGVPTEAYDGHAEGMWGRVLAVLAVAAFAGVKPAVTSSTPSVGPAAARLLVQPVYEETEPRIDIALDLPLDGLAAGRIDVRVPAGFGLEPSRPLGSEPGNAVLQTETSSGFARYAGHIVVEQAPAEAAGCPPQPVFARWGLQLYSPRGDAAFDLPLDFRSGEPAPSFSLCAPSRPSDRMTALRLSLGATAPPDAPGLYRWRAIVTPLAAGGGSLLPGQAYEVRGIVPVPHILTLDASPEPGTRSILLHGRLTAAGKPRANVAVQIVRLVRIITPSGFRVADRGVGWSLSSRSGAFTRRIRRVAGATYIAVAPAVSGRCAAQATTCVSATYPSVQSDPVTVAG